MRVELFGINDAERMRAALAIRLRVFVEEQGVPPDEEIDAHDHSDLGAVHGLVYDDAATPGNDRRREAVGQIISAVVPVARRQFGVAAVAAGRYYPLDPRTVQIGRMAVEQAARGRGAGSALLSALMAEARARGFARVRLHAQVQVREFYRRAGFRPYGPTFLDAGIVHQAMMKPLA